MINLACFNVCRRMVRNRSLIASFFSLVKLWRGLGRFIAGLFGYHAGDTLVMVMNVQLGSFELLRLLTAFLLPPPSSYCMADPYFKLNKDSPTTLDLRELA